MTHLDWAVVKEAAHALGVSKEAFKKWKWRKSIPPKWRLPIIEQTDGKVSAEAFRLPKSEAAE